VYRGYEDHTTFSGACVLATGLCGLRPMSCAHGVCGRRRRRQYVHSDFLQVSPATDGMENGQSTDVPAEERRPRCLAAQYRRERRKQAKAAEECRGIAW